MFSGYYTKLHEHKFHGGILVVEGTSEIIQFNSLMCQRETLNQSYKVYFLRSHCQLKN